MSNPTNPGLSHASCAECHATGVGDVLCETCHTDPPSTDPADLPGLEADAHRDEGRISHGMGDLTACRLCHAPTFCKTCHDVELPHDQDSFPFLHGDAAREAPEACVSCHSDAYCDACHGIPMPHPDNMLPDHSRAAVDLGEELCQRCHIAEDCKTCHIQHIHPGIPSDRLDELRGGQ